MLCTQRTQIHISNEISHLYLTSYVTLLYVYKMMNKMYLPVTWYKRSFVYYHHYCLNSWNKTYKTNDMRYLVNLFEYNVRQRLCALSSRTRSQFFLFFLYIFIRLGGALRLFYVVFRNSFKFLCIKQFLITIRNKNHWVIIYTVYNAYKFYGVLQICFKIKIVSDLVIKLYGMLKKGFYTNPNGCL